MKILSYDGTYKELINLVNYCTKTKTIPDFVVKKEKKYSILINSNNILFLLPFIHDKYTFLPYLSDIKNIETLIIHYHTTNDSNTLKILKNISKKVLEEFLNLKEKIYFFDYNKVFISTITPTFNIIDLLCLYFFEKLQDKNWIIYDKKRKIVVVHNHKTKKIYKTNMIKASFKPNDRIFKLWEIYKQSISL